MTKGGWTLKGIRAGCGSSVSGNKPVLEDRPHWA